MFENLQEKLSRVFKNLSGRGKITEKNVKDAVREVKLSLLEADVNYKVVKEFVDHVLQKALGEEVLKSLTPDQQFIKIVRDELIKIMGEKNEPLRLIHRPAPIMMVGLQGSGKTTTCAKLAKLLKKEGRNPLLVAADLYRPAAVDQLVKLGNQIGVNVVHDYNKSPVEIVKEGIQEAERTGKDVLIVDTAGRLHIDEDMMRELEEIKAILNPDEILLVVDAMMGQDAVNTAKVFDERLDLTGFVVTKMDGDARGGVILSIKYVTGKPVKFIGTSEKLDGLEPFHPDRIANRILGMGDVLSLIEKVERELDQEKMKKSAEKFLKAEFTLEDFKEQLQEMKKLGPLSSILEMLPGAPKVDVEMSEKELKKIEAIINSMTIEERRNPRIIDASRKRRIARGSGTTVQDVNKLLKSYEQMKVLMKRMKKGKFKIPFGF
ncbi:MULTISPECIES: signal recognition particle protein [Thermotoga]|jgi:signal recognition particle subunit SRP54|uniref:Signal recognition particle protein n=1 Tax=Thermotoga neapolitana (strain ATCC 49049 / DSM 4359 / NBRC 107923 / NS-E) TaxID=309803 RepID=B9K8P1_THENN|nr:MULTISPECIES: signal recognition particle protein [Thermotoga]MDK2785834.1 signal recognition particle subunit [Thermotoga sp.]HBF11390.1 signal recognition particle protein [Thermotoga neapolitana]ACM23324.1 Signal recognition particle protein [Thermotoga neapolitana DSM 4359]AJG41239.1 signal recognition particle [Thermotoga sp. RQ7]KFZ21592.1 signal recognition particle protein Srp54 [Thermotoga neapolitana LA10]